MAAIDEVEMKEVPAGVDLSFSDIRYAVQVKKEAKPILNGISGMVKSGTMMCILGPTGCGKTSLLHILASKLVSGHGKQITGVVRCNQAELTASQFQRIAGLVTQEDIFNAALTVQETLSFAAKLKLASQRKERISLVVKKLQLENCISTYVGDDSNPYLKGISGGEKRRLAIAMEIMDPSISLLVLDEPTSGLDAAAALNVANLLRSLADTGIAVVATLHQPRASIMSNFESLMVLAKGRRVFYGPLSNYIPYLEADLQCDVPKHESPYDFLLDAMNPLITKQSKTAMRSNRCSITDDCDDAAKLLADIFERSDLCRKMGELLDQPHGSSDIVDELVKKSGRGIGWCGKCFTVFHRTFIIKIRDPMVLMTQISTAVMMGLMFGTIYWQCYEKQLDFAILDTQMCLMLTTMMSVWLPYDVTLTFPRERQIFLRERKAGLYSTSAFYVARVSADMPLHIIAAAIMALIIYPMAGLRQGVLIFVAVNVLGILVGASMMQLIGAVSKSFEEANILMMLVMMMSMVMSTGFIREVPSFLEWMREISVMGLVADLTMYYEFRDIDAEYGDPNEVLANFGVRIRNDDDVVKAVSILATIYVICRILTFVAVKFLHTGRSCAENVAD